MSLSVGGEYHIRLHCSREQAARIGYPRVRLLAHHASEGRWHVVDLEALTGRNRGQIFRHVVVQLRPARPVCRCAGLQFPHRPGSRGCHQRKEEDPQV